MLLSIHSTYSILRFPHLPRYRNGVCKSVSESWIDNNLCQTLSIHRQLFWRYPFRKEMYHLRVRIWFEWTKNGKYLKRPWVEFEQNVLIDSPIWKWCIVVEVIPLVGFRIGICTQTCCHATNEHKEYSEHRWVEVVMNLGSFNRYWMQTEHFYSYIYAKSR